jgi:hypothetical protein
MVLNFGRNESFRYAVLQFCCAAVAKYHLKRKITHGLHTPKSQQNNPVTSSFLHLSFSPMPCYSMPVFSARVLGANSERTHKPGVELDC